MNTTQIIAGIDEEIARLKQVKALLSGDSTKVTSKTSSAAKKRRPLSPEARARIVAAQKKRWAAAKKAAK